MPGRYSLLIWYLLPVKLVFLAWLQAVTQGSSRPLCCTSTITHMVSETTWGGAEKARGGAPALNWLRPVVIIYWLEWVTWVCLNYKQVWEMKKEWVSTEHCLFFLLEKRNLPIAFWYYEAKNITFQKIDIKICHCSWYIEVNPESPPRPSKPHLFKGDVLLSCLNLWIWGEVKTVRAGWLG